MLMILFGFLCFGFFVLCCTAIVVMLLKVLK